MAEGDKSNPIDVEKVNSYRPAPKLSSSRRPLPKSVPPDNNINVDDGNSCAPLRGENASRGSTQATPLVIDSDSDNDEPSRSSRATMTASRNRTATPRQTPARPSMLGTPQRASLDSRSTPSQGRAAPTLSGSATGQGPARTTSNAPAELANRSDRTSLAFLLSHSPERDSSENATPAAGRLSVGREEGANKVSSPVASLAARADSDAPAVAPTTPAKVSTPSNRTPTPVTIPIRETPRQVAHPRVPNPELSLPKSSSAENSSNDSRAPFRLPPIRTEMGAATSKLRPERDTTTPSLETNDERTQSGEFTPNARAISPAKLDKPGSHRPSQALAPPRPIGSCMPKSAPCIIGVKPKIHTPRVGVVISPKKSSASAPADSSAGPHERSLVASSSRASVPSVNNMNSAKLHDPFQAETAIGQSVVHFARPASPKPTSLPQVIDAEDLEPTVAIVEDCIRKHLKEVHESHAYITRAILRRQRTSLERQARWKKRFAKQGTNVSPSGPEKFIQKFSPFKDIEPQGLNTNQQGGVGKHPCLAQEIFSKSRTKDGVKSKMFAPITTYRSTAVQVPPFREYVSVDINVLAENETRLLNWPYFIDDKGIQEMESDLQESYRMKNELHPWHDLLTDVYRFYGASAEAFLEEIGIKWEHLLYWHLASNAAIKDINSSRKGTSSKEFEAVVLERKLRWADGFDRNDSKWKNVLQLLARPSTIKLRMTALASSAFVKQTGFDLWHLVRRSPFMQQVITSNLEGSLEGSKFEFRNAVCRVCQLHNCLFHGELTEQPEAETTIAESQQTDDIATRNNESGSEYENAEEGTFDKGKVSKESNAASENHDATSDSDVEDVINYRRAVNTYTIPLYAGPQSRLPQKPGNEFKARWWLEYTNTSQWKDRTPFYPCNHEGTCDQAQCRCYRENINCEKTCGCSSSCNRRFPGCPCAATVGKQRMCRTERCPCFLLNRECDADLCGNCGATEILDPVNRYNEDFISGRCCNVPIQRGVAKKTLLGHSEVHGFGLYTGEDVKKDDFLGEYKGEIVTQGEGDRRGIIYDKQGTMYLFNLNQDQEIDSTHVGNKTRFINNADLPNTNCYPKNTLCNTVHRIGIFAAKDLKAGIELYFHYGYPKEKTKKFKQPGGKKSKPTAGAKLIAVKTKPKAQSASSSASYRATSSSSVTRGGRRPNRRRLSTPERQRQTANARAAVLAKKAQMAKTAPEAATKPSVPQRAKKSAPSNSSLGIKRVLGRRRGSVDIPDGMDLSEQFKFIADDAGSSSEDDGQPSTETPLPSESQEVRDSDSQDVWVPSDVGEEEEEEGEEAENSDISITESDATDAEAAESDEDDTPVARTRRRQSLAPVVAVKQRGGRRGGARPGAGRKRKRRSIDDEDA